MAAARGHKSRMLLNLKPDFRVPAHALRALIEIFLTCEAGVRPVSLRILTLPFELRATCLKLISNTIIGYSPTLTSNVLDLFLSLFPPIRLIIVNHVLLTSCSSAPASPTRSTIFQLAISEEQISIIALLTQLK